MNQDASDMLSHVNNRGSSPAITTAESAILIIDDERAIREALVDILGALTEMAVYAASNGREGLQLFRQLRQSIILVLLDLDMPVMNGEETYARLRQIAPQVKVIVSSSLSLAETKRRFGEHESLTFLPKPYDVRSLLNAIQTVSTIT
jgi:CheY-like chemotaxis protein